FGPNAQFRCTEVVEIYRLYKDQGSSNLSKHLRHLSFLTHEALPELGKQISILLVTRLFCIRPRRNREFLCPFRRPQVANPRKTTGKIRVYRVYPRENEERQSVSERRGLSP